MANNYATNFTRYYYPHHQGETRLRDLADVENVDPSHNTTIVYNSSTGLYEGLPYGGGGITTFAGLSDTTVGTPAIGEELYWDGASWTHRVPPPSGETNDAVNVGVGTGTIYRDKTGTDINLKTLVAGTNVSLVNGADDITINATDTGEANDAVNVGTGTGTIYRDKTGTSLNLKTVKTVNNNNISILNNTDDVTLDVHNIYQQSDPVEIWAGTYNVLTGDTGLFLRSKVLPTDLGPSVYLDARDGLLRIPLANYETSMVDTSVATKKYVDDNAFTIGNLDTHPDVEYPVPRVVNDFLGWDNITLKWKNSQIALGQLSNVTTSSPSNGQVLTFNGTNWVNLSPTSAVKSCRGISNFNNVLSTSLPSQNVWTPVSAAIATQNSVGTGVGLLGTTLVNSSGSNKTYQITMNVQAFSPDNDKKMEFAVGIGTTAITQSIFTHYAKNNTGEPESTGQMTFIVGLLAGEAVQMLVRSVELASTSVTVRRFNFSMIELD